MRGATGLKKRPRRNRRRDASSGEKSFFQHSIGDVPVNGAGFLEKHSVVTD